jgi:hypothetical protein
LGYHQSEDISSITESSEAENYNSNSNKYITIRNTIDTQMSSGSSIFIQLLEKERKRRRDGEEDNYSGENDHNRQTNQRRDDANQQYQSNQIDASNRSNTKRTNTSSGITCICNLMHISIWI